MTSTLPPRCLTRADFLAALHDALDERRDPLEDERVRDWLERHPEDLEEFSCLRASVVALERRAGTERARRHARRLLLPLAAAAALLVLLLWPPRHFAPAPDLASPAHAAAAPTPAPPRAEPVGAILAIRHSVHVAPATLPAPRSDGPAVLFAQTRFTRSSP